MYCVPRVKQREALSERYRNTESERESSSESIVLVYVFSFFFPISFFNRSHQVFIGLFIWLFSIGDDDNARVIACVCCDSFTTQWKLHLLFEELKCSFYLQSETINEIPFLHSLGKIVNKLNRQQRPFATDCRLYFPSVDWIYSIPANKCTR